MRIDVLPHAMANSWWATCGFLSIAFQKPFQGSGSLLTPYILMLDSHISTACSYWSPMQFYRLGGPMPSCPFLLFSGPINPLPHICLTPMTRYTNLFCVDTFRWSIPKQLGMTVSTGRAASSSLRAQSPWAHTGALVWGSFIG